MSRKLFTICLVVVFLFGMVWGAQAQLNPKVITDQEIADHAAANPANAGLDAIPLSQAKPGGTLTWSTFADPRTGLPLVTRETTSWAWFEAYVIEAPLEVGFSGEVEDALAESFEISEDGQVVLLTVRQGLVWNDGTPFTAEDILFSYGVAFRCVVTVDEEGNVSLEPYFDSRAREGMSVDGECSGLPVVLNNTSFIDPGPDGKLESTVAASSTREVEKTIKAGTTDTETFQDNDVRLVIDVLPGSGPVEIKIVNKDGTTDTTITREAGQSFEWVIERGCWLLCKDDGSVEIKATDGDAKIKKTFTSSSTDDVVFGNRILPAAAHLTGGNIISGATLETAPQGDDVVVTVADNQVAIIWSAFIFGAEGTLTDNEMCCIPKHILGDSAQEAIDQGDPGIFESRWSLSELQADPSVYVGTGPFMLESFSIGPGGGVTLVRNPNYWKVDEAGNRLPKLDRLHKIRFADQSAEFLAFLNGQTDLLTPRPEDLAPLQAVAEERNIRLFIGENPGTAGQGFITLNEDVGLAFPDEPGKEALGIAFRNPEVRRALSQAFDRVRASETIGQGLDAPRYVGGHPFSRDITFPQCPVADILGDEGQKFCDAYQAVVPNVAYDIDAANAKLDAIGLVDRDGDGVRDIPAGFGFIVPGPNGVLDSTPEGDDFVLQGFEISGLEDDPGIIEPGPNGVLDTTPAGDDFAHVTSTPGSLSFTSSTNVGNTTREAQERLWVDDLKKIGVQVTIDDRDFITLVRQLLATPPQYEAVVIGITGSGLIGQILSVYGSCAFLHVNKTSDCDQPEGREPFQVRIDELGDLALQAADEETFARLHAELQLLQAANVPWIFRTARVPLGAVRVDRVNAEADPETYGIPNHFEVLFRMDLQ